MAAVMGEGFVEGELAVFGEGGGGFVDLWSVGDHRFHGLGSWKLFAITIPNFVKTLKNFDRDACNGDKNFGGFDSACKDKAENILPALPSLRMILGHGGKTVEQDLEDFCVGFVGIFVAEFGEEMGELLAGFGDIGIGGVVVLNANLITLESDIASVDVTDVLNVEGGLIFACFRHEI
jgi:hypothetical protein